MSQPAATSTASIEGPPIAAFLQHDHQRLERLFARLVAAFEADARDDAIALWTELETGLRTHFDLEERELFPELALVAPHEAEAFAREHDAIRAQVAKLGVGLDLRMVGEDDVRELVRSLQAHAQREDPLLYRWAQTHLPTEGKKRIRDRLLAAARHLVGKA